MAKWEGKVSTKLENASAKQIWPLVKDFFNLHRYFSTLSTCYGIHGENGELGCVRYCSGFSIPSNDEDSSHSSVSWSIERLVTVDHVNYSLSYEIVDSNIGFESYESTIKIIPGGDGGDDGCVIEWLFTVDPLEGWRLEDLMKRYEVGLQSMCRKMEDALIGDHDK